MCAKGEQTKLQYIQYSTLPGSVKRVDGDVQTEIVHSITFLNILLKGH